MPKIVIQEDNLTRATGSGVGTDIVYVPGLIGMVDGEAFVISDDNGNDVTPYNTPILCTNMDEFEMYFGEDPYEYEDANGNKKLDTGFIYAKECLAVNLPVVYEAIKPVVVNHLMSEVTNSATSGDGEDHAEPISKNLLNIELPAVGGTVVKDVSVSNLTSGQDYIFSYEVVDANGNEISDDKLTIEVTEKGGNVVINNPHKMNDVTVSNKVFTITVTNKTATAGDVCTIKLNFNDGTVVRPFEYASASTTMGPDYIYEVLPDRLDRIADKSMYQVKYITSGGYPSYMADGNDTLAIKMMAVARTRGDAIALIDHENEPNRVLAGVGSIYSEIKNEQYADGTFGTMFTPYASYTCSTINDLDNMVQVLPASYAYLVNLGRAIQTSPNWLAIAGVNRGIVAGIDSLQPRQALTNTIADMYQPTENGTAINAITDVKPYGLTIWGNRTLARVATGLTAEHFLNTRNMISDIKKNAYSVAKSLLFEQDSDALWLSFKAGVSPLLEQLIAGNGISAYQLNRLKTKYNKKPLGKGEVACVIKIFPRYAVEAFEITVVMADEDVSVS